MFGALFKNDVGGVLISDSNPTYMQVTVGLYGRTSHGTNTQTFNTQDNRAWANDADIWSLWNWAPTKTLLFNTPWVHPNNGAPLVAVNFGDIPSACWSAWKWNTTGAVVSYYAFDPGVPLAFTRRYYETYGLSIVGIERVRDYSDGYDRTEWRLVYVSGKDIPKLKVYVPMDSHYVNHQITTGLEVRDVNGVVKFSTRVSAPFTGHILRPKNFVNARFGGPLQSNDIRWAEPRHQYFTGGLTNSDWLILSTNGYGTAASTVAVSEWRLEENAYGGDLYKRVHFVGCLGDYRVGVARCGGDLHLVPLFHRLHSYGNVWTASSSFGSILMGTPDVNASLPTSVAAPNYTVDDASNVVLVIN
jgi:hypothetical protein